MELRGYLRSTLPHDCDDLVFLFVKSGGTDPLNREINPRQSLRWDSAAREVIEFRTTREVHATLGISIHEQARARSLETIRAAVAASTGPYAYLALPEMPSSMAVFTRATSPVADELARKLSPLLPVFEVYRGQSLYSINDTYHTRHAELLKLAPQMSASTAATAQTIMLHFAAHRRFNVNDFALLEYQVVRTSEGPGHRWVAIHGTRKDVRSEAERLIEFADTEVLESRKALGLQTGTRWALMVPFTRIDSELSFEARSSSHEYRARARQRLPYASQPGDHVICLMSSEPLRQGVLHSMLYFRQYYFDTYKPALVEHLARTLAERTVRLREMLRRMRREDQPPNPWEPLRRTCEEIFPTLRTLFGVSIAVYSYDIATYSLRLVASWPGHDSGHARAAASIPLNRGARDMNATTFTDSQRCAIYSPDLARKHKRSAHHSEEPESSAQSRYCHKLSFRQAAIGTISFESIRRDGIPDQVRTALEPFIDGIERYLDAFISAQDANWLSLTAAAYHHLHELRQIAETRETLPASVVLEAISAFDQTTEEKAGHLAEFQAFLENEIERKIAVSPDFSRVSIRAGANVRCRFDVLAIESLRGVELDRTRLELTKRIFRNLFQNFSLYARVENKEAFSVHTVLKPFPAIRFRQVQNSPFADDWMDSLGFRPVSASPGDRLHHGIFLCSAIARYLGGYAWVGNQDTKDLGMRSVIEVLVPLTDGGNS